MNRKKVKTSILLTVSAICMFYGLTVVTIIGPSQWFNYAFMIIGAFFGLWAYFQDAVSAMPKIAKKILTGIVLAGVVFFAAAQSLIIFYAADEPAENADYVVILGAKVNGETPSREFSSRIRAAASYLEDNPGATAVTTGGKGNDEDIAEARAARIRLLTLGIPDGRILSEEKSVSTEENLRFAADAIRASGGDPAEDSVVIVSLSFHLFRAGLYAKREGFGNVSFCGSTGLKILIPHYCLREFAAIVYEAVF